MLRLISHEGPVTSFPHRPSTLIPSDRLLSVLYMLHIPAWEPLQPHLPTHRTRPSPRSPTAPWSLNSVSLVAIWLLLCSKISSRPLPSLRIIYAMTIVEERDISISQWTETRPGGCEPSGSRFALIKSQTVRMKICIFWDLLSSLSIHRWWPGLMESVNFLRFHKLWGASRTEMMAVILLSSRISRVYVLWELPMKRPGDTSEVEVA